MNEWETQAAMAERRIDVMLMTGHTLWPNAGTAPLYRERIVAAIPSEHPLAEMKPFTVHDLRRTGSALLKGIRFNRDWIQKSLAHKEGHWSRGAYDKAEYEKHRRHALQEWASIIDAWVSSQRYPGQPN